MTFCVCQNNTRAKLNVREEETSDRWKISSRQYGVYQLLNELNFDK